MAFGLVGYLMCPQVLQFFACDTRAQNEATDECAVVDELPSTLETAVEANVFAATSPDACCCGVLALQPAALKTVQYIRLRLVDIRQAYARFLLWLTVLLCEVSHLHVPG